MKIGNDMRKTIDLIVVLISIVASGSLLISMFNESKIKAGIFAGCQLMPLLLLNSRKVYKFVRDNIIDLLVSYCLVMIICAFVQYKLKLSGYDKFLLCYMFTCVFYILVGYILTSYYVIVINASKTEESKKEFSLIFFKFSFNCFLSNVGACLSVLGYFGTNSWISSVLLILLVGGVTTVILNMVGGMIIHS